MDFYYLILNCLYVHLGERESQEAFGNPGQLNHKQFGWFKSFSHQRFLYRTLKLSLKMIHVRFKLVDGRHIRMDFHPFNLSIFIVKTWKEIEIPRISGEHLMRARWIISTEDFDRLWTAECTNKALMEWVWQSFNLCQSPSRVSLGPRDLSCCCSFLIASFSSTFFFAPPSSILFYSILAFVVARAMWRKMGRWHEVKEPGSDSFWGETRPESEKEKVL